ncbi:uncharacterized protein METZ01_LOCUS101694, partial [marine metagenome]
VEGAKKGAKKITQISTLGAGWDSCLLRNFYVDNDNWIRLMCKKFKLG